MYAVVPVSMVVPNERIEMMKCDEIGYSYIKAFLLL